MCLLAPEQVRHWSEKVAFSKQRAMCDFQWRGKGSKSTSSLKTYQETAWDSIFNAPIFFCNANYKKQNLKILARERHNNIRKPKGAWAYGGERNMKQHSLMYQIRVPGIAEKVNARAIIQDLVINQTRDVQLQTMEWVYPLLLPKRNKLKSIWEV